MAEYIVKWTPIRNGKEVLGTTTTVIEASTKYEAEEKIRNQRGEVVIKSVNLR